MMTDHRGIRRRNRKGNGLGGGARVSLALLGVVFLPVVACDSLLEVDIPGSVFENDLHDPRLAETLAVSAQGDFECAFKTYQQTTGLWADDFEVSGAARDLGVIGARLPFISIYGAITGCQSTTALWTPLHVARFQGERGAEILAEFSDEAVPNKSFLIGKSLVHAAYSYVFLAEAYCSLAFDQGPEVTREVGFNLAVTRFGEAMAALGGATGADAAEAADLMNFARVGRGRANLNLGNDSEVVADASQVSPGFERTAFSSSADARLYAPIVDNNTLQVGGTWTVHERWRGLPSAGPGGEQLTVPYEGGVPDPRVPILHLGLGAGHDGVADLWANLKYTSRDDDIRIADWAEAQLMIAEVEAGRGNGAIAVGIINLLRDTHDGLPHADPVGMSQNDIIELVREERRRELWLEGTRMGDKLRWNEPWSTGVSDHGTAYGTDTCIPLQEAELLNNPNFF